MVTDVKKGGDRNQCFDFLKGLGCIGVIFIHVRFPGLIGEIIAKSAQFAVPIFFMIAGYMAMGCFENTIKRRFIKILKIFIYGYLCFLTYNAVFYSITVGSGTMIEWFKAHYTLKTIIDYMVFCTIDFAIPLWYLIAMIETYIFWYFVVKWKKENFFVKLMPILFLFQLFLYTICETHGFPWAWKINFISSSLPWFLFGYYIHSIEEEIDRKKSLILATYAVIGLYIALLPTVFDTSINFSCLGILIFSTALFVIAVKNYNQVVCKPVAYIGDKLSLNIYIFHVLMARLISIFFNLTLSVDAGGNVFLWIKPILTVIATIIFSWTLYIGKQHFIKL